MPAHPNNREIKTTPPATNPPPKTSRLSILSYLAAGFNPAKIAAKMNVSAGTIQYHLSILKRQGIIRKVGYGTWEILKPPESEKKTTARSPYVGIPKPPPSRGSLAVVPAVLTQSQLTRFQQDAVRTHAITTTWQVPRGLRNWDNPHRTQYLDSHNIPHIQLGIAGGGQRSIVKDRKVWLLNKVLIIYDKASYFAQTALEGKNTALALHLRIIKHVERLLHTSFLIGSDYKFKVSRQHYALIHNALAQQYNEAGEKLEVRTGKGLWLLIDNSNNIHELEGVHPRTGMTDTQKTQAFFNGLKDIPATQGAPSYTPGFVLKAIAGVTANQTAFAENIESHISAIQDLGAGVRDMNALLKEFAGRR